MAQTRGNQRDLGVPTITVNSGERARIEVFVRDLRQLFHSLDPSPFYDRDLDDNAKKFIVESARELPREAPLSLVVHVQMPPELPDAHDVVTRAVHSHFGRSAKRVQTTLRELFRRGRRSLAIGLPFLAGMVAAGELVAQSIGENPIASVLRESLVIGGWVAMWRPMEIFLYDWWPIRAERRLYERLATIPVEIVPAAAQ